jgi:hypothetical protein
MPESYADDYTMRLIAGTHPDPRVAARWLVPDNAAAKLAEDEPEAEEVETKVVAAPRKRGRARTAEAETK